MGLAGVYPSVIVSLVLLLSLGSAAGTDLPGQEVPDPVTGPVIEGYGPVWEIAEPDFPTNRDEVLRVVFDVAQAAPAPDRVNARFETLARYLNMHARAGVPRENMKLALVVHGGASWEVTGHDTYRERFGMDNPNLDLLEALDDFGVEVVICGQSQSSRGIRRDQLAAPVRQALSAMTALVDLQDRGYRLIAF